MSAESIVFAFRFFDRRFLLLVAATASSLRRVETSSRFLAANSSFFFAEDSSFCFLAVKASFFLLRINDFFFEAAMLCDLLEDGAAWFIGFLFLEVSKAVLVTSVLVFGVLDLESAGIILLSATLPFLAAGCGDEFESLRLNPALFLAASSDAFLPVFAAVGASFDDL